MVDLETFKLIYALCHNTPVYAYTILDYRGEKSNTLLFQMSGFIAISVFHLTSVLIFKTVAQVEHFSFNSSNRKCGSKSNLHIKCQKQNDTYQDSMAASMS